MNRLVKGLVVAAAAAVFAVTGSGCGTVVKTGQDQQALWYEDGELSAQKFQGCVTPSLRERKGLGDRMYYYPAGLRTFSFTGREGSEAGPVSVKTKDSQEMNVVGFITFTLTSDCNKLREFHEKIGLKYGAFFEEGATESKGWSNFLNDYMAVPLNSVMDKAGLQNTWRNLYSDPSAVVKFEQNVQENIGAEVAAALGDDGFINVQTVNIETPQPSQELLDSLKKVEQAKADAQAETERANAQKTSQTAKNQLAAEKYKGVEECRKVYSEQSCLTLDLADRDKIQFYPQGSSVIVQPK